MRVLELWRYPVKSLLGERLDAAAVTADGIEGDRRYALYDAETGMGLTARRVPELLFARAALREGMLEITLPDGSVADGDAALSDWLGRRVVLRSTADGVPHRFENVVDFEHEPSSAWETFDGAPGAFHDQERVRVSLVSTATVDGWDPRRFRSNLLLDGAGEDELVGTSVAVGDAVLDVGLRIQRCVMTTRAQAGGIDRDLDVLRTIARERDARLAVGALVSQAGTIRAGDALTPVSSGAGRPTP
jgi:uncharacterized protein